MEKLKIVADAEKQAAAALKVYSGLFGLPRHVQLEFEKLAAQIRVAMPLINQTKAAFEFWEQTERVTQAAIDVLGVDLKSEESSVYRRMFTDELWAEIHARKELDRLISAGKVTPTEVLRQAKRFTKQQQPGPIPPTAEERANLVIHFVSLGVTEKAYLMRVDKLYSASKWMLDTSLQWARENQDYFRGIPGIKPAIMKMLEKRLQWR